MAFPLGYQKGLQHTAPFRVVYEIMSTPVRLRHQRSDCADYFPQDTPHLYALQIGWAFYSENIYFNDLQNA